MALAKIVNFMTEDLSDGNVRIKIQYDGIPTPKQAVDNGRPPRGIVFRQLVKRGYLSENGKVLKPVRVDGYIKKAHDGKSTYIVYQSRPARPISEVVSDIASKIASKVIQSPFEPNPSRQDPRSN